ncbi:MAG: hypothetical protein ACK5FT_04175 [Sphingomonadales bacterium]
MKDPLRKIKDVNGVRWKGQYAAPLVNAELNLEDAVALVNPEWINSFPDKTLVVHYDKKHFSKKGEALYTIYDRNFSGNVVPTAAELSALNSSGMVTVVRNFVFDLTPGGGLQFDSIWLKEGVFTADIAAATGHQGKVTIEFPDLKKTGAPVLLSEAWSSGGSISRSSFHNVSDIESLDLSKGNQGFNQIRVKVSWEMTKSGAVGGSEQLQLNLSTQGLKFRKLYGFLGQPSLLNVQDSINLSLFSVNILKGSIVFEDARIKVHFNNGTGFQSQYQIQQLSLVDKNGSPVPVTAYNASGSIGAATDGGAETRRADSVYITKASGSNVAAVMRTEPHYLTYKVGASPGLGRGFVWDNSTLGLTVSVELPMSVSTKDLVLEDTSDLDLGIGKEGDYVEMIKFKVNAENGIPLGVGVQCFFLDAANKMLDSLFQPFRYMLKQANVDAGGNVISPYVEQWELVVDKPRLSNILKAKRLRTRAWIPTSSINGSPVPVRITTDQKLKFKLGAEIKLSADAEF